MLDSGNFMVLETPSIREYETRIEYLFLTSLLLIEPKDFDKYSQGFNFVLEPGQGEKSHIDMLVGLAITEQEHELRSLFEEITGLKITKSGVFHKEYQISDEEMNIIKDLILVSINRKDKEDIVPKEESDFQRKKRENEERLNKIKTKTGGDPESNGVEFADAITLMVYELGMSVEEIKNLNYYGFNHFASVSMNAPHDKIAKGLYGSGNVTGLKDYKNITAK